MGCSNNEKNEVAVDYNEEFIIVFAGLIRFGLGQRDPEEMLHFERTWPKLSPTPDVKAEFSKSAITARTYSGLICSSFCVSFWTNTAIDKIGENAYEINFEGPKMKVCKGLEI